MNELSDFFKRINEIKEEGHIFLIKFDGERKTEKITVLVNYIYNGEIKIIKEDGDNLINLLEKVLKRYNQNNQN